MKTLTALVNGADNRYLTDDEQATLLGYTASVPKRLEAMRAIEAAEANAVKHTIAEMQRRYPQFNRFHAKAWGKAYRDIQLVVRYQAQALLLDDPQVLLDKALIWLRTILASFNFTPKFNRDTYELLKEGMARELAPEHFALLEPYLDLTIEVMSDFPEPATPMV